MNQDSLGNTKEIQGEPARPKNVSLNDLPIEIFIQIFAHVSPLDLKDLRLVCRKWNDVVLDRETWTKAFDNRLGTGKIFASATRSHVWITEYFGRMAVLRRWQKAKAFSRLYQVVNDRHIDQVVVDFTNDRLLMFSLVGGSITLCTLTLGKNQVFIPESDAYSNIVSFDITWNYSCVGNSSGGLYLKNLITATSTGFHQSSVKRLTQYHYPTVAVKVNRTTDKFKSRADIVSVSQDGRVSFWNIDGGLVKSLELNDSVLDLKTDFKTFVIIVSQESLYIIDYKTAELISSVKHGFEFQSMPVVYEVDFHDSNIVICDDTLIKCFHYENQYFSYLQGSAPESTSILRGTMQASCYPKNEDIAGGDGLLFALTLNDGSVIVFNIRDLEGNLAFKTRIMPFQDDRSPQGLEAFTMVALNSTVIAIGAVADFVHFYDAHSGKYLREGTKVSRKFTRYGRTTILKIELGPMGACGIIVSDDSIQYFRYGDEPIATKKPNAPQAVDLKNRRALSQHIKTQMDDYNELKYEKLQQELLADKFNGVSFDDEQDELRVALALSASCARENGEVARWVDEDHELEKALKLSQFENHDYIHGALEDPCEGLSRAHEIENGNNEDAEESEDELLRKVLERSLIEH